VNDDELAISVITVRERLEGAENAKLAGAPSALDIAADVDDFVRAHEGRILPISEAAAATGRGCWCRITPGPTTKRSSPSRPPMV
jgi:hypothetical protein